MGVADNLTIGRGIWGADSHQNITEKHYRDKHEMPMGYTRTVTETYRDTENMCYNRALKNSDRHRPTEQKNKQQRYDIRNRTEKITGV